MSLVTRCTSCGTVFRVVQDQLKVSGGWVRCGKCGEVFNALQTLFDLERGQTNPAPAAPRPTRGSVGAETAAISVPAASVGPVEPVGPVAPVAPLASAAPAAANARDFAWTPSPGQDSTPAGWDDPASDKAFAEPSTDEPANPAAGLPSDEAAEHLAAARDDAWARVHSDIASRTDLDLTLGDASPAPSFAASAPSAPSAVDFPISIFPQKTESDARHDGGSVWPSDEGGHSRWIEPDEEPDDSSPRDSRLGESASRQLVPQGASTFAETPEFLRTDRAEQRWNTPLARGLMSFAALALGLLLLGQWAVHERDRVADSWPASRPLLAQWCRVTGCELLAAPRRLEAFTVESTALTRAAGLTDAYRLTITVRNRAEGPATLPNVELSLTDADGQLLSRRVLSPPDFRVQRAVIPSGGETTMQLVFTNSKGRINGYTIDLFYP